MRSWTPTPAAPGLTVCAAWSWTLPRPCRRGGEQDTRPDIPAHARSVWEVHVADFSADEHSGVKPTWRGKFMGFTPDDTTLDGDGEHQPA